MQKMKKLIDCMYGAVLKILTWPQDYRRWKKPVSFSPVRVFFGFDRLPTQEDPIHGGIVKLLDLDNLYPNHASGANILYLISSALPMNALRLVRFARQKGVKIVLNQNGLAYHGWYGKGWEKFNEPIVNVWRSSDYVFYQSQFCRDSVRHFFGETEVPGEVLYNAVDTSVFSTAKRDPAPEELVLITAGSHHTFYRVKVAMDTLALVSRVLPQARMIIAGRYMWGAGEREALQEAQQYAQQAGLNSRIEFQGSYSQLQAVRLLHQGHILLHTKYNDPCPRLVVEALSCGLPVIYSATGGVPELVGDKAGIGVPGPLDWESDHPPAPKDLAEAVLAIAGRRGVFSEEARRRAVMHFDVHTWLDRHQQIFEKLLAEEPVV
jgi:glycosyltransferase involved in cell wall biosynthesis